MTTADEASGPTVGAIEWFMTRDHVDLDKLLLASRGVDGRIDRDVYARFRERLLRHIAMEEKVLIPFARAKLGTPLMMAADLRREHGVIAKLLVQSPTGLIIDFISHLLSTHNSLEEGPAGLYAMCDALAGDEAEAIVERLRTQPTVPLAPYYDGPEHRRGRA